MVDRLECVIQLGYINLESGNFSQTMVLRSAATQLSRFEWLRTSLSSARVCRQWGRRIIADISRCGVVTHSLQRKN